MEGGHLTAEAVSRMVLRTLPPPEILAALRHLGECEACRENVRGGVPDDFEVVRSTIREEAEEQAYRPPARRGALLVAASVVIAIQLVAVFSARRPFERSPRPVIVAPPSPAPSHPEWDRLVREARASGRLPFPPALDALRGEWDSLRGVSDQPGERLSPAGVVIDDTRPSFIWPSTPDAAYVVSIMDGDDEIARSAPLAVARWTPERELPRARTYAWQVEVRHGRETSILPKSSEPLALFRIVGEREHRDIAEARRLRPADHFLHAVLYARAGLRAEALTSLRASGVTLSK